MQHIHGEQELHPGDICRVLATDVHNAAAPPQQVDSNSMPSSTPYEDPYSRPYYRQYVHVSKYRLLQHKTELPSALLDRGANGCMITKDDPEYNGSMWNVQIEWNEGSHTFEPLSVIAADDPVSCVR